MKAIVYHQYGAPEVLKIAKVEKPTPKDHEILIKVAATTVTAGDTRMRNLDVPLVIQLFARIMLGIWRPKRSILGMELSGEVEAVGKDVTRFKKGDQVFAATLVDFGAYAEYKCVPENSAVALKPANISLAEAAALPIGARTALHYLKAADIQPGHKILIYGASGSVGTYAVQLAKHFGATVTGVCSTANVALVKSLGADTVIDYTKEDFAQSSNRYDIIFHAVHKRPFADFIRILKPNGTYLNITNPFPTPHMLWTRATTNKRLILGEGPPETAEALISLKALVEAGTIRPVIDRSYTLEQIVEAHTYVDKGHKQGNVVIKVARNLVSFNGS